VRPSLRHFVTILGSRARHLDASAARLFINKVLSSRVYPPSASRIRGILASVHYLPLTPIHYLCAHRIFAMSASNAGSHVKMLARSYKNLDNARQTAAIDDAYNSPNTRKQLTELFHARFGGDPHDWQLDVTEAILLGLDTILIAGTGSGKTMPFMMPLLLDDKKKVLVLSPLKILQEEQVSTYSFEFPEQTI